jgi:Rhodopirellula transposase DDE domain
LNLWSVRWIPFWSGQAAFPTATQLLILADAGGSNSYRARLWKERLQAVLCDRLGLQVTVCHFPPGTSKWNPIEHRLFSFISGNCAGMPLCTWVSLAAIRGTTTKAGLTVEAVLHDADVGTSPSRLTLSRLCAPRGAARDDIASSSVVPDLEIYDNAEMIARPATLGGLGERKVGTAECGQTPSDERAANPRRRLSCALSAIA